jgi:hypothetical protein
MMDGRKKDLIWGWILKREGNGRRESSMRAEIGMENTKDQDGSDDKERKNPLSHTRSLTRKCYGY